MRQANLKQTFIGFILLTAILFGNFSAFAQKRGGNNQVAGNQSKKECSSGYNGSVKYTKTVTTSSSGKYGGYHSMKRTYQLNVQIRDDGRQLGSVSAGEGGLSGSFTLYGNAAASETENFTTFDISEKDDYCKLSIAGMNGKTRVHCESKFVRQSDSSGTAPDTSIYIGLQGDKMKIGITSMPKLNGTSSETSDSHCTGTCSKDQPINHSRSSVIKNGGETSAATDNDANIKFNPKSFNRLSGTWTKTDNDSAGGTTTETYQWNLSRCARPIEIDNIHFEQKQVQKPNNWIGVDALTGAYDGNIVKIKATVFNNGGDTAYASVKFSETKSGEPLPNGTVSVKVDPGESRDVGYEWDTNGYAWNENQTKETEREIKAEIEGDSKTEKIKILPKPVILVHGLWSNAAAWGEWHSYLREAHSFAWEAFPVGEDANHGKMNTGDHAGNWDTTNSIFQNAQEVGKQIKWVREQKNAWHVDLVVHSMGGLISRFYIHNFMEPVFDNKPEIAHLVMLGTPNMGSACADLMYGAFNMGADKPVEALRQLKPAVVEEYNKKTFNRKNVKFSILAGFGAGPTCGFEIGDGVVPLSSALYNIVDRSYAGTHHLALTEEKYFKSFVMPRIAVGPKKAKSEQTTAMLDQLNDDNFALALENDSRNKKAGYFRNVSYKNAENNQAGEDDNVPMKDPENLTTRIGVKLAPKQTKEVEIPVRDGTSAGVVLLAMPYISATLTDANGRVVGTSPAITTGLGDYFRTIFVQKEIKNGVWKLKLENVANVETTVLIAGFTNTGAALSFKVEAGKSSAAGQLPLTAKWTINNAPVLNAKITANVLGQAENIEFFDDGKHGDGAANDGVYGASVGKLPAGDYSVEAKAEANGQTAMAVTSFNIGGANTSAKSAVKPQRKN